MVDRRGRGVQDVFVPRDGYVQHDSRKLLHDLIIQVIVQQLCRMFCCRDVFKLNIQRRGRGVRDVLVPRDQIVFFSFLGLHCSLPESGDLRYKSGGLAETIWCTAGGGACATCWCRATLLASERSASALGYRGTSLIRNCFLLGPCSRSMPRAIRWS